MGKQDSLVIHEIYKSIQGESTFAGVPCTFVRTTGCDLRCRWCDTPQAFYGGERLSLDDVVERVLELRTPIVELTGGEPLLQPGTLPLLSRLCDEGKTVLIETGGHRDISGIDPRVHRIVDLKPPGSGESDKMLYSNVAHLTDKDEVKFVLASREDYEWMREAIHRHALHERTPHLLVSVAHGELDVRHVVEWVLDDELVVRVQLQLHKFIWSPETTGV